ncbi:hypothetical protein [Agromyces sp. ZXT2-6]|uniref:hypothetical protein n=1 Tax=Agromyces sp. ZXT2-6 TaxID=3461153 RepID=UPI004055322B
MSLASYLVDEHARGHSAPTDQPRDDHEHERDQQSGTRVLPVTDEAERGWFDEERNLTGDRHE